MYPLASLDNREISHLMCLLAPPVAIRLGHQSCRWLPRSMKVSLVNVQSNGIAYEN